jgi:hypothetical protein
LAPFVAGTSSGSYSSLTAETLAEEVLAVLAEK